MHCPHCQTEQTVKSMARLGKQELIRLACNHSVMQDYVEPAPVLAQNLVPANDKTWANIVRTEYPQFSSTIQVPVLKGQGEELARKFVEENKSGFVGHQGQKLYPFQETCIEFAKKAQGRALFNLDVGLGKTPVAIVCAELLTQTKPVLIFTKARLKMQWMKQIYKWTGKPSLILDKVQRPLFRAEYYLISFEVARKWADSPFYAELGIKTVIIDECQHIRGIDTKRSVAVKKICDKAEKVMALSAHPIKNKFSEYYPTLHCLQPKRFPSYAQFIRDWCHASVSYMGKPVGGSCRDIEEFHKETRDFIIRFTQDEVLPDLPKVRRDFQFYDLAEEVEQKYKELENELVEYMETTEDTGSKKTSCILAYLVKMRHFTGISKVNPTIEDVSEFLLSCDRKIVVFIHHQLVAELIIAGLNSYLTDGGFEPCLHFKGGMADLEGQEIINKFVDGSHRVLVASTLAAGEGLDGLQKVCWDARQVERQWNSVNEEQTEGRLGRIGQEHPVQFTYMIALGTIDEWLTELVENKRAMVHSTLSGEIVIDESSVINELANMVVSKRQGKRWDMKKFYKKG